MEQKTKKGAAALFLFLAEIVHYALTLSLIADMV